MESDNPFQGFTSPGEVAKSRATHIHNSSQKRTGLWMGLCIGAFVGGMVGTFWVTGLSGFADALSEMIRGGAGGLVLGFIFGLKVGQKTDEFEGENRGLKMLLIFFVGGGLIGSTGSLFFYIGEIDRTQPGTLATVFGFTLIGGITCGILGRWMAVRKEKVHG